MFSEDKMMRDPGAVFKDPLRVLEHPELSRDQKAANLKCWREEILKRQISVEENTSGKNADMDLLESISDALLQTISDALQQLGAENKG